MFFKRITFIFTYIVKCFSNTLYLFLQSIYLESWIRLKLSSSTGEFRVSCMLKSLCMWRGWVQADCTRTFRTFSIFLITHSQVERTDMLCLGLHKLMLGVAPLHSTQLGHENCRLPSPYILEIRTFKLLRFGEDYQVFQGLPSQTSIQKLCPGARRPCSRPSAHTIITTRISNTIYQSYMLQRLLSFLSRWEATF